MKKIVFVALVAAVMSVFCACGDNAAKPAEEKFEKGIFTTSATEMVEIFFQEGESPYFGVSMRTGSAKDNIVWISFYRAGDVDKNGNVKQGAIPSRYYQIMLPPHEVAKKWGYGPIVTQREDGTEHEIRLKLINQPG